MRHPSARPCPTCKKVGEWFAARFGPFCSKRCRLIDLGKWLGGEHTISEPLCAEHLENYAALPSCEELDRPERD